MDNQIPLNEEDQHKEIGACMENKNDDASSDDSSFSDSICNNFLNIDEKRYQVSDVLQSLFSSPDIKSKVENVTLQDEGNYDHIKTKRQMLVKAVNKFETHPEKNTVKQCGILRTFGGKILNEGASSSNILNPLPNDKQVYSGTKKDKNNNIGMKIQTVQSIPTGSMNPEKKGRNETNRLIIYERRLNPPALDSRPILFMNASNFLYSKLFDRCRYYRNERKQYPFGYRILYEHLNYGIARSQWEFNLLFNSAFLEQPKTMAIQIDTASKIITIPSIVMKMESVTMMRIKIKNSKLTGFLPPKLEILWLDCESLNFCKSLHLNSLPRLHAIIFSSCPALELNGGRYFAYKYVNAIICLAPNCQCKNSSRVKKHFPHTIFGISEMLFNNLPGHEIFKRCDRELLQEVSELSIHYKDSYNTLECHDLS
uniref:LRR domain-containing protein n=1 Tax=Parastrongyloides trichosuri TaxID=131310 RepID=A0A0N5A751_PARTI